MFIGVIITYALLILHFINMEKSHKFALPPNTVHAICDKI
jgi:hypothetical protein